MAPKQFYVAYKTSQNIVCMEVEQQRVLLYLKLDPKSVRGPEGMSRDVSDVGHYGTGDLEGATPARRVQGRRRGWQTDGWERGRMPAVDRPVIRRTKHGDYAAGAANTRL